MPNLSRGSNPLQPCAMLAYPRYFLVNSVDLGYYAAQLQESSPFFFLLWGPWRCSRFVIGVTCGCMSWPWSWPYMSIRLRVPMSNACVLRWGQSRPGLAGKFSSHIRQGGLPLVMREMHPGLAQLLYTMTSSVQSLCKIMQTSWRLLSKLSERYPNVLTTSVQTVQNAVKSTPLHGYARMQVKGVSLPWNFILNGVQGDFCKCRCSVPVMLNPFRDMHLTALFGCFPLWISPVFSTRRCHLWQRKFWLYIPLSICSGRSFLWGA